MLFAELQAYLAKTKRYAGAVDNVPGKLTDAGILLAMTDGPDTRLTDTDFVMSAKHLGVQVATIKAFWKLESNGVPFINGRAPILPERHRFSRNTNHVFDKTNPSLSAPNWDKSWYPPTQDGRWDVILQWVRLLALNKMPIDAAFASVSYGGPQIMGENYKCCGYDSPFAMAVGMARDEAAQLDAFEGFVRNAGILPYLQKVTKDIATIQPVVARYNGTAYRENKYDTRFRDAFIAFGGSGAGVAFA